MPSFRAEIVMLKFMSYKEKLNSWAVVRLLPNMQRIVIAVLMLVKCIRVRAIRQFALRFVPHQIDNCYIERFRTESDADGYVKVLHRLQPEGKFIVAFDPVQETDQLN